MGAGAVTNTWEDDSGALERFIELKEIVPGERL
jgi:hypothetical protein